MTICDKTWKITAQTCQKYVEFASSYWTRKSFFYLKIPWDYFQSFLYLHKTDNENIHPTQICQKRYLHATMAIKQNTNPFNNWNAHFDNNCQICDAVKSLCKGVTCHQEINKTHKKYPGGWPTSEKYWKQSVQYTLNT